MFDKSNTCIKFLTYQKGVIYRVSKMKSEILSYFFIVDNGTTFNYDGHLDIYKMYGVKLLEKVYSKFKHIKVMPFVKLSI